MEPKLSRLVGANSRVPPVKSGSTSVCPVLLRHMVSEFTGILSGGFYVSFRQLIYNRLPAPYLEGKQRSDIVSCRSAVLSHDSIQMQTGGAAFTELHIFYHKNSLLF